MARAVALAKLVGIEKVDWALGHAAVTERFDDQDLESIINHREAHRIGVPPRRRPPEPPGRHRRLRRVRAVIPTNAPPLPDDLEGLLRSLRLPHVRRAAPEVIATAKSQ